MSLIDSEPLISLGRVNQEAKGLPRRRKGQKPSPSWFFRAAKTGNKAPDGSIVILETRRVGSTLCTSEGALRRFFRALSGGTSIQASKPVDVAEGHERAERELAAAGL